MGATIADPSMLGGLWWYVRFCIILYHTIQVQWLLERTLIPGGTALVAYPSTHLGSPIAPVVAGLGAGGAAGLGCQQQFECTTTTEEVAVRGSTAVEQLQRRPQN